MSEDQCVATKNDGEECEYAAKYPDGKCGIHSDHNERGPGRPSKLTDEVRQDVMVGARQGMTIEGCARLAGVAEKTFHSWLNENPDFRKSFRRARAQGELQRIQSVNEQGSRFILERSYGYVKTEKRELEHSGDADSPIMVIDRGDSE
jgi:hypothetical protein